jgi:hypothetical protein
MSYSTNKAQAAKVLLDEEAAAYVGKLREVADKALVQVQNSLLFAQPLPSPLSLCRIRVPVHVTCAVFCDSKVL